MLCYHNALGVCPVGPTSVACWQEGVLEGVGCTGNNFQKTPPHTHTHMHVPPVCTFCASCVYVLGVMFARDQFHGG
jgi:hypothetical protein